LRQLAKRLTFANVMSSLAVFLVLGGTTAFAASHLGKGTIGTRQLKKNAVTAAKIKKGAITHSKLAPGSVTGAAVKDGSLGGADLNVASLPTVPSASSAATANALAGRVPFAFFTGPGTKPIVTIGPFTISSRCEINVAGLDLAELQISTSVDGSSYDDNSGDVFEVFDVDDGPAQMIEVRENPGQPEIEADEGQLVAVAPDGTTIATENQAVGVNIARHQGQCFFAGTVVKIG
jgi:hypothetical protein